MHKRVITAVDGPSFHYMMTTLGVRNIAAEAFYRFLQSLVAGGCRSSSPRPYITMTPDRAASMVGTKYRENGFDVISCSTKGEQDDVVLQTLVEAADPAKIGTIIVVTTDGQRFIDPLLNKKRQGIQVLWGAADILNPSGSPAIGERLRGCLFGRPPEFKFINLKPQIPRWDLMLHPRADRGIQKGHRIGVR
jgi:hypothetical protein